MLSGDRDEQGIEMRYCRNTILKWLLVGCAFCAVGFWASPYVAATRFAKAAASGDADAIVQRIDVPRLRMAFARQIVRAYPVDPVIASALDPAARYGANLVAVSYVDALIAEHLTSEAIVRLISAQPVQSVGSAASALNLPSMQRIGGAWDVFISSGFTGLVTFAVDVPAQPEGNYRLGFRLVDGTWKLASLGLPAGVLTRAVELLKQQSSASRLG